MADIRESNRDFLVRLLAALGWNQPDAIKLKDERDILAEVLRLREAAGEAGETRLLVDMDFLSVVAVRGGPGLRRDPDEPPARTAYLWVITRAGVVEVVSHSDGGESEHHLLEYPKRNITLTMAEAEARQAYEILGRAIASWDEEAR